MTTDVLAYLHSKGIHTKRAGADEVNCACFFCFEDENKRGRLYINVSGDETVAGLHMCHLCGTRGNLRTLKRHFGDKVEDEAEDRNFNQHRILQVAADFYHGLLTPENWRYLQDKRGLEEQTINDRKLGWAPGGTTLYGHLRDLGFKSSDILATGLVVERDQSVRDFFNGQITIPYIIAGNVVMLRGKDPAGKYLTPPGQKTRLFNTDVVWGAEELVICEGEFDTMVLEQLGFNAIGCPGANTWQDSFTPYFEDTKRIYVVFDPDEAGEKGAAKLREALGQKAKIVELPVPEGWQPKDVDPSALAVEQGWRQEHFARLFRAAVRANSLLSTPREAFAEWDSIQGLDGFKFGFELLDAYLKPGLLAGQLAMVLAKTNVGKTMHMLNVFQRASMKQPDAKFLFISLEQTRGDWAERARRIWYFYNREADPREVNRLAEEYWADRIRIVDKNRLSPEQLYACIEDFKEEMGGKPSLVAIDYLGYWAHAFSITDRYAKVTEAVMALKAMAKDTMIPFLVPHQLSRKAEFGVEPSMDEARDSGAIEETADYIFTYWAGDTKKGTSPEDQNGEQQQRIAKTRSGGKMQVVRFQFAPMSFALVPWEDSENRRLAREEFGYMQEKNCDWRTAIWRHRTGLKTAQLPTDQQFKNVGV